MIGGGIIAVAFSLAMAPSALAAGAGDVGDGASTLTGTADAGTQVHVFIDGIPADCLNAPVLAAADGTWSCVLAGPPAAGTHTISRSESAPDGSALPDGNHRAQADITIPDAGSATTARDAIVGYPAAEGAHTTILLVPAAAPPPPEDPVAQDAPVVVPPAPPAPTASAAPLADAPVLETPLTPAPRAAAPPADDANLLTAGLPTISGFIHHPELLAFGAVSTAALMLLVIFPVELLNSTMFAGYDRIFGWLGNLAPPSLQGLGARMSTHPLVGGVGLTAIAALAFSFNDPEFGTSLASLRLFLALLLALLVIGYLATALTALILRERWHLLPKITLKPFTLVLSIVGVGISRLLDFSPGFMIGLVLGISLAGSERTRSRAVLLRSGIVLGFGIAAWLGYNALHESLAVAGEHVEPGFGELLTLETLAAITTEGITALVVALLPFRFLEGDEIFHRSHKLWVVSYGTVLLTFFVLVVSSEHNWRVLRQSVWGWLGTLMLFAVVCVTAYLILRARSARHPEVQQQQDELVE